ncbi:MAG: LysR family transcriptional regulator, partial [Burkholderiaceae bacterium]|nr:LysR family transcriptional regulator [Burkholderiaceae bacterium]
HWLDSGTLRPLFPITAPAAHPYQVRSRDDSPAAGAFVAWLDDVCARSRAHAAEWLSGLT